MANTQIELPESFRDANNYRNQYTTLQTNLNVSPYYDDFNVDSQFYRILFKPGYAVQARELTQIQSMLQNQVTKFGKHVFKEGSVVLGAQFAIEKYDYVKVSDLDTNNQAVDITQYVGKTFTNPVTGLSAYVNKVVDGSETAADKKMLFVRYTNSGTVGVYSGVTKTFSGSDVIVSDQGSLKVLSAANDPIGYGSIFFVSEGVIFAKNHFLSFPTQSVIIDRYSTSATCRVGFIITEEIIKYSDNISLLDPALESSNYSAPGADRLKLVPILTLKEIADDPGPPDYVDLIEIRNGVVTETFEQSQYARLGDEFAARTFDESGDYYVNGLTVQIKEHLNNGVNDGKYNANTSPVGDANKLTVGVESGTAYIKGYKVWTGGLTKWSDTDKSTAFANVNNQISASSLGNYFICNEYCGSWSHDVGTSVNLYNTAQTAVTSKTLSNTTATGSVIGTAKIKAVEYLSGTLGSTSAQVEIYLFNIQINSGYTLSQVKSIVGTGSANMFADIVLESGSAVLKDTTDSVLLYQTGSSFTKTVRGTSGTNETTFTHKRSKNVNISSSGQLILNVDDLTYEQFPYGSGSFLGSGEKRDITLNLNESFNIAITGYAATTSGSKTVTGVNTFFTRLNPGDKVTFTDIVGTYIIDFISNDTAMNLTTTAVASDANTTFSKVYVKGDVIDLTTKGSNAGAVRTVQQTSSTGMTIELNETLGGTKTATISYRIYRRETKEVPKVLRSNRYVVINCSTAGTTGPFNLGLSDVYKITSIRKNTGAFSTVTDGSDVTGSFVLDNGQRDELYDHAKIIPTISLSSTDYLLVKLDYFYPDYSDSASAGYFSINSYPINDSAVTSTTIQTPQIPFYKSPVTGFTYDLRNCLDFRPIKQNTANDSQTLGGASTDPATTNTFYYAGLGYRMPAPDSQIQYDYSYYLARRDIVVIDKDGKISIIQGVSSIVPITPETPPNVMNIASIFISPYPSLSPYYASFLNRMDQACISKKTANIRYTMRDIGILKSRIENLEYYTSLNALEKQAADFVVLDANSLDRFKNGIFADTFRDHTLGATNRPDYRISVDSRENSIRPVYDMEDLYYRLVPNSNTNIVLRDSLLMLDYTEEAFIEQKAVTTYRNIETSVYRYVGNLVLNPETDIWVDTQTAPDNQVTLGSDLVGGQVLQSEYNAWQSKVVGYKLYQDGALLGTYNNLTEATSSAEAIAGYYNRKQGGNYGTIKPVILETTYDNTRSGREVISDIYTQNQSLGERVTDVELVPYMRPQVIKIFASGMKAITRFYVYFDGVDMTKYITPTWKDWSKITPVSSTNENGTVVSGWIEGPPEGSALTSDEFGEVWAELRIPADGPRFRVGTKEVIITDSPTNNDSATSTAVSYFVSQGLVQTKQDTILTTRQVISLAKEVSEYQQTQTAVVINPRYGDSCTAYSFFVKAPEGEEGLFLSSVDVWLASSDVENRRGVWFEIKEMDNGGGVTRTQVPLSEVWYDADYMNQFVITPEEINELTTREAKEALFNEKYLRVKFRAPVFLYKDRQYAFTIHTQGVNPYTYFWMSKYGENDLITGNQVTARPMTGTLFATNNNLNWTQVIGWDLKVKFNRAKFKVNNPLTSNMIGTLTLTNELYERPLVKAVSNTPYQGEKLVSTRIRLTNPALNTKIEVGDRIVTFVNVVTTNTITNIVNTQIVSSNISVIAIHDTTANTYTVANSVYFVDWDTAKGFYNPLSTVGVGSGAQLLLQYYARDAYYSNLANFSSQSSTIRVNAKTTVKFEFDEAIKNGKLLYVYSANGAPRLDANGQPVTVNVSSYLSKTISLDKVEDLYSDRKKPSTGDFYASLSTETAPREFKYTANTLSYNVVNTTTVVTTNVNTITRTAVTVGSYRGSARASSGNIDKDDIFVGQESGEIIILQDLARFSYSALDFEPAALSFNDSYIKYEMKTTQNAVSPTLSSSYVPLTPSENYYFNTEQVILSKSEQGLLIGGADSHQVKVSMYTISDYTSPVIDLARTHGIFIYNIINSDITDETAPTGGALHNKYISKTITLADGQDAEDIKVLSTAYRPTGTDVKIWAKIRHDEDSDFFDNKDWVELISTSPNLYSASSDFNDWKEFEYDFPSDYDEIITCTRANTLPSSITLGTGNTLSTLNITANIIGTRIGNIYNTDNKGFVLGEKANVVNSNGYVIGNTIISGIGRTPSINANTSIVEYWTQTGVNFKGYKQFSVKIGLSSNNSAIVPRVADIRSIALQS